MSGSSAAHQPPQILGEAIAAFPKPGSATGGKPHFATVHVLTTTLGNVGVAPCRASSHRRAIILSRATQDTAEADDADGAVGPPRY